MYSGSMIFINNCYITSMCEVFDYDNVFNIL